MASNASSNALKIIFTAMAFSLGFAEFVLIGIVPDVAESLGEPVTRIGDIVGFYALACAVATPVLALLGGRLGQKRLALVLLCVFDAANLLVFFADTYPVLLASRMGAACTSGTLLAIILALAPDVVGRDRAGSLVALVLAGFSVSSVVGVPLGTLLSDAFMWKAAYVAVFICGLISSVLLTATFPKKEAGASVGEPQTSTTSQVRILTDRRVILNALMILATAAGTYVFYTYLTPVLEGVMGFSTAATSVVLLLVGAACIASNIVSGKIADNGGIPKLPLVFGAQMVALALLFVTPSLGLIGVANILALGLVMYAMNSSVQMVFQDVAREDYPAAVTFSASLHPMTFNAGIAVGSFIGGAVVNSAGLEATGLVGAVVAGCALALCLILKRVLAKNDSHAGASVPTEMMEA
ncbi:MFS transporter [Slackia isoflavoniconvertens]|uniref:MFS transporter n=1 Tax=Slackia isoflavoniconvertens TaxID=572010 RepID=A0A369LH17_9ACTN|nr:MFS transporter [Slackia isoflavoniconvertens]RDB57969.1 MFS transporter [Slackia isoflavoniconvertens]